MKLNLNLTEDELKWLEIVTQWGAEVTRYLQRRQGEFRGKKDWHEIQFSIYEKVGGLRTKV